MNLYYTGTAPTSKLSSKCQYRPCLQATIPLPNGRKTEVLLKASDMGPINFASHYLIHIRCSINMSYIREGKNIMALYWLYFKE